MDGFPLLSFILCAPQPRNIQLCGVTAVKHVLVLLSLHVEVRSNSVRTLFMQDHGLTTCRTSATNISLYGVDSL